MTNQYISKFFSYKVIFQLVRGRQVQQKKSPFVTRSLHSSLKKVEEASFASTTQHSAIHLTPFLSWLLPIIIKTFPCSDEDIRIQVTKMPIQRATSITYIHHRQQNLTANDNFTKNYLISQNQPITNVAVA